MIIENEQDFKKVKSTLKSKGLIMITPKAGEMKIKSMAYKDEMILFEFESEYQEDVIVNLRTGVRYWLTSAAEILMKQSIANVLDSDNYAKERARLLGAAECLSAYDLETVLDEAEDILAEKKKGKPLSPNLQKEYDRLVADLETGNYTYSSNVKTSPAVTYNWARAMEETRNL